MTEPTTAANDAASPEPTSGAGFEAVLAGAAMRGLGGVVPPVRDVAALAATMARSPVPAIGHAGATVARLAQIAAGTHESPGESDRRFSDDAWASNPVLQRLALSYLAMSDAAVSVLEDADLDWRTKERLRMPLDNLIAALAPSNVILTNPAGWKQAIDTGGASLLAGARQFVADVSDGTRLPTSVDRSAFEIGNNIAATPGVVIHRTRLCELIEYLPRTEEVDAVPVVMVPSPVNKYYLLDLEPERSVIREELDRGRRVFLPSWVNPGPDDADVGFDDYVAEIVEVLEVVSAVTRSKKSHLLGLCGGGVLVYLAAAYLAAIKKDSLLATLTIAISVIDYYRGPAPMAYLDADRVERSARGAARRGYFDARSSARSFALMRPNDGIWSSVVNNYVLGRRPPQVSLLAWAADQTNLAAKFGTQLLRAIVGNSLIKPGAVSVLDEPLNPRQIEVDTYILGADTDHISPWTDCYRTADALGGPVEFVLAKGGHATVIAKGPSTSRASHWTGPLTEDATSWLDGASEQAGSWWVHWNDWIERHTPQKVPAPVKPGSRKFPPIAAAPGDYVRQVVV